MSGTSASLRLELSNPMEQLLPFQGCPAVGIPLVVTLCLTEPVAEFAVKLDVSY